MPLRGRLISCHSQQRTGFSFVAPRVLAISRRSPARCSLSAASRAFGVPALGRARRRRRRHDDASGPASAAASPATPAPSSVASLSPPANSPLLAAIALQVNIYSRPDGTSKKLGYLALGAPGHPRSQPAGSAGCQRRLVPRLPARVCLHRRDATTDLDHPLARAAAVRPDITKPMPYRYAFVRAVAPLYLRIPTAKEQLRPSSSSPTPRLVEKRRHRGQQGDPRGPTT